MSSELEKNNNNYYPELNKTDSISSRVNVNDLVAKMNESKKKEKNNLSKVTNINELIKTLKDQVLVIFSKKGFFLENFRGEKLSKLVLFTENKYLAKAANLKENISSFYTKFPKERWPEIKIAEQDNEVGNAMMAKLGKEFDSNYRPTATASDLHD